ncbi:MAG: glycosyltransferase family 2 protein [Porphyromonas sp.]|nr:glycosyltransferase family 2 protein [Porphyromonas sp.]
MEQLKRERLTLSVITVCYNAAPLLERTLKSVQEQNYPHIEYIIIDGASKDNTLELVRDSGTAVSVFVSEKDAGIYDAMNKGLKRASGHYVLFMNAGDTFYDSNTVSKVMQKAIDRSREGDLPDSLPAVLYGHTEIVDYDGRSLGPRKLSPPKTLTWKSFKNGMLVCHQSFYARRDLAPFYDNARYRLSADFDWCLRILCRAEKEGATCVQVGGFLTKYLHEGATTKHHKASLKERFSIMKHYYGLLPTLLRHLYFLFRSKR